MRPPDIAAVDFYVRAQLLGNGRIEPAAALQTKTLRIDDYSQKTARRIQKDIESGAPPYNAPREAIAAMH